jgi:phosphopantothenoylcysteine decarboxylase/phosphopantothenate--cysteine ligase
MKTDPAPAPRPSLVMVAVCGGIAAYKAADLVSRLRKAGHDVQVVMSDAAREFVTPLTFAAVSGHPVLTSLFPREAQTAGEGAYPHLYPATRADAFVVAPATADMMARLAQGFGSDIVSTCALSLPATCLRLFCPAMNVEMWRQPVVQENVRVLEQHGWQRIGPDSGALACGMEGEGRMAEPAAIAERLQQALAGARRLAGRRVLVISGPTREHLDPVRFIGNPSTGRMGRALAEEALASGARVDFVTGPVAREQMPAGDALRVHPVVSAEDMLKAARKLYRSADIVIYAAAVADYRPVEYHAQKLPKTSGPLVLRLEATPDVAATLNARKQAGQVTIGFALQTEDGLAKAGEKLKRKNLDGIVLNALDALGGDEGTYTFIGATGAPAEWGRISKRECAGRILDEAVRRLSPALGA